MKRLLSLFAGLLIFVGSYCQVPVEEAELAYKQSKAKPSDGFIAPDKSVAWTVEVRHIRGNRYLFLAHCTIFDGYHIFAKDQPIHPWGPVEPTRVYLSPRSYLKMKGRMIEKAHVKYHKCTKDHDCVTDHDRRIHQVALYTQKIRLRNVNKNEKRYLSGIIEWRADTDSSRGRAMKYGFILLIK